MACKKSIHRTLDNYVNKSRFLYTCNHKILFVRNIGFTLFSDIKILVAVILVCLYLAYFIYAMVNYFNAEDEGMIRLLWVTCFAFALGFWILVWDNVFKPRIERGGFQCNVNSATSKKVSNMYVHLLCEA